jgi:hypothetical protein
VRHRFPTTAYNFVTLFGVSLALFALAAMLILYLLDVFAAGQNPYLGIVIFLVLPAVLILGLGLIPLGMWRERRRRARGDERPLVVDLGNPRHRNAVLTFVVGTSIFLLLSTIGLYQGYHYTETVEFCGEVCHQVMEPEHVAYLNSPHARVECVACHIGPGAGWYVRSKLSGARQVFKTALGTYPRPIPTPIENLRPAQEVCEQCHWPQQFFAGKHVTYDHFLADRDNTHWRIVMEVRVGGTTAAERGRAAGIHWHIDPRNRITYVAADSSRQSFEQVTWAAGGDTVVYARGGRPLPDSAMAQARARGHVRTLDCIDCHNRPSHHFRSPAEAVNAALASSRLDGSVPWLKRQAVEAMSRDYPSREAARDSIARALGDHYAGLGVALPAGTIETVQDLYSLNVFPEMQVRWSRYPENDGHLQFPGCFRCHGSDLATPDGRTIRNDCNLCHTILAQGPAASLGDTLVASGLPFRHPVDIGGAETAMACTGCHAGDASVFLSAR